MKKGLAALLVIMLVETVAASSKTVQYLPPQTISLLIALLSPFVASILVFLSYSHLRDRVAYIGIFSAILSFLATLSMLGTKGTVSFSWIQSLGIAAEFYIDGFSLLFGILASGIGILVFTYSKAYMEHKERKRKYYTVLTAFMGSMIGLVFSSNMILLFLFWELTSICSFLLISHHQRTKSGIKASKKSLFITVGSGMMLLIGFTIIESATGTFSIAELLSNTALTQQLAGKGLYIPALLFLGIGAAAKSAQVPLHIWLPDAMEAPTPVSAFLHSATMVKAGVYLIGRFRPLLMTGEAWNLFLITLGLVTMTVAAFLAVSSTELKELLAYSTASHLGLIFAGFGFSSVLGAETATFHILNHAVFKASLFMVAGIVLHEAGTQKISELSGLRKRWPVLAAIATISGLSMAGFPPLNGFFSKELLFESAYHAATHVGGPYWILPVIAVSGSVFTFLYSLRFISVFYGDLSIESHEVPRMMLIPPGILAFLALAIGLFPNSFLDLLINPALANVAVETHGMSVHLPTSLKPSFVMSLVTIASGLALYRKEDMVQRNFNRVLEVRYLKANFYYRSALEAFDYLSDRTVGFVETGLLRTYVIWVLVIASLSGISGFFIFGGLPQFSIGASAPVLIVLATSVASAYAVLRSDTYISSVLTLSILGFMVSIFYLLNDAPDLVMTQLVVETLSLIIFLLVLNKLPELKKNVIPGRKYRDILISGIAGLAVFLSVIYSTAKGTPQEIAEYYLKHAVPGSGGGNVVNVILVDFRGLDTMGEISVIAMAGLSVLMLFQMRRRGDEE